MSEVKTEWQTFGEQNLQLFPSATGFTLPLVPGIPTLILLDAEGHMITRQGRVEVLNDPECRLFPWHPRPVLELSEANAVQLHEGPCLVLFVGEFDMTKANSGVGKKIFHFVWCNRCACRSNPVRLRAVNKPECAPVWSKSPLLSLLPLESFFSPQVPSFPPFERTSVSFRCWGGRWIGASQRAHSAYSREAYGQVQSQGGGDAAAVLCGWRGEISHSRQLNTIAHKFPWLMFAFSSSVLVINHLIVNSVLENPVFTLAFFLYFSTNICIKVICTASGSRWTHQMDAIIIHFQQNDCRCNFLLPLSQIDPPPLLYVLPRLPSLGRTLECLWLLLSPVVPSWLFPVLRVETITRLAAQIPFFPAVREKPRWFSHRTSRPGSGFGRVVWAHVLSVWARSRLLNHENSIEKWKACAARKAPVLHFCIYVWILALGQPGLTSWYFGPDQGISEFERSILLDSECFPWAFVSGGNWTVDASCWVFSVHEAAVCWQSREAQRILDTGSCYPTEKKTPTPCHRAIAPIYWWKQTNKQKGLFVLSFLFLFTSHYANVLNQLWCHPPLRL